MQLLMYMEAGEDVVQGDLVTVDNNTFQVQNILTFTDDQSPNLNYKVAELDRVEN
jgi:hypothetical protein